ncbi:MAG TPA: phosphotransferase, partial [Actinomycetota bacterium]
MRASETSAIGRRRLFGKIYPTRTKADVVYATMSDLVALNGRPGRLTVARPVAHLANMRMIVQERLAGTSLDVFLRRGAFARASSRSIAHVRSVAGALAELHTLDISHPRRRSVAVEFDRLVTRLEAAAGIDPELDASIGRLADRLRLGLVDLGLEEQPERMVHADCKPSQ